TTPQNNVIIFEEIKLGYIQSSIFTDSSYDPFKYPLNQILKVHHFDFFLPDVGDHNFCRNPDGSEKPWCYVSVSDGATRKEACDIRTCQGSHTFENADSFPSQVEGAAVQPVKGVQQQVRSGPKKKKDLGTLGYVLAVFMMAIIILLGGGITMGYFYKRGRDLKKQHEQRVYEREMHRITLPLSAFANPTCELVDENTIVITAEPNNQTPTQEPVEGADPLMGTAGTPGA
uniref:Phosphoinositide-3-kinase-interacting protein 1-like n=1 Tax=Sinocyclocheilus rhinocerous TaxID=307959 RepID=A0A673JCA1_9TELE